MYYNTILLNPKRKGEYYVFVSNILQCEIDPGPTAPVEDYLYAPKGSVTDLSMSPILATCSNPIAWTEYRQDHYYFYLGLSGQALIGATSARGTLDGDPEGFVITNHTSKNGRHPRLEFSQSYARLEDATVVRDARSIIISPNTIACGVTEPELGQIPKTITTRPERARRVGFSCDTAIVRYTFIMVIE